MPDKSDATRFDQELDAARRTIEIIQQTKSLIESNSYPGSQALKIADSLIWLRNMEQVWRDRKHALKKAKKNGGKLEEAGDAEPEDQDEQEAPQVPGSEAN